MTAHLARPSHALPLCLVFALSACPGGGEPGDTDASTGDTGTAPASETGTGEPTTDPPTTDEPTTEAPTTDDPTDGTTTDDPTTDGEDGPPGEEAHSDEPRDESPIISADELATMAADERAFAVALLGALDPAGNTAISPTSLRVAFGMTYAGARTVSADDIPAALRFSLSAETTHAGLNTVDLELGKRDLPPSEDAEGDDSVELALVNQVFGRPGVPWDALFLDVLAASYGSGIAMLDFAGDPEASRLAINGWVGDQTRERIPELLPAGAITGDETTVLVNALYLKAPWSLPFTSVDEQGSFTLLDATTTTAAMMSVSHDGTRLYAGAGFRAAELPLRGNDLTLVVLLPDAGTFDAFVAGLDGAALGEVFAGLEYAALDVVLPRFKFSVDHALKDPLTALGMTASFVDGDFSGMTPAGADWTIAEVFHDVFVGVDEKGVEAAAATAVIITDPSGPGATDEFIVDRPFLFAIRDRPTDSLLFLGRVVDPTL